MSPVAGQGEQQEHNLHMNVNLSIIIPQWLAGSHFTTKGAIIFCLWLLASAPFCLIKQQAMWLGTVPGRLSNLTYGSYPSWEN